VDLHHREPAHESWKDRSEDKVLEEVMTPVVPDLRAGGIARQA